MKVVTIHGFWLVLVRNGPGIFRIALNRLLPAGRRLGKILIYAQCVPQVVAMQPVQHQSLQINLIRNKLDPLYPDLLRACPDRDIASRLIDPGNECYVARAGSGIVGYAWTVEGEFFISEINYRYALRETEFFIYDCFVEPGYRGKGIYPALLKTVLQDKAERRPELTLAYIGVASENRPSRRGIIKAGFIADSSIGYLRWGDREKWWHHTNTRSI